MTKAFSQQDALNDELPIGYPILELLPEFKDNHVPHGDVFRVSQNNFDDWLHVWRMDVNSENVNRRDIHSFSEETMKNNTFTVLQEETENLGSVKASFGLEVHFRHNRQNVDGEMEENQRRYSKEDEPHVFTQENLDNIFSEIFDRLIDRIRGKIDNWSQRESGWDVDKITIA